MVQRLPAFALALAAMPAAAQDIVKVPASSEPTVARPDDLFNLPPGQWHFARQLWSGDEPCDDTACEAGFTTGDLVVSVERAGEYVRIIAGLRGCESVGFAEVQTGKKASKYERKKVAAKVDDVVKGVATTCNMAAPRAAQLDAAMLFPAKAGS